MQLYVDGELVGSNSGHVTSWSGNHEYLQVGALGWSSRTEDDAFRLPFAGEIEDVRIYSEVLDASQIEGLATGSAPVSAFSVASDDAVLDTGPEPASVLPISSNDAVLDTGTGQEQLTGGSEANAISGTDGNDKLSGTLADDLMTGGDGDDLFFGRGGNDHLVGGAGNDTLRAGAGDDIMAGGAGDDLYVGSTGYDTIVFNGDVSEFTFSVTDDGSMIVDHTAGDRHEGRDNRQGRRRGARVQRRLVRCRRHLLRHRNRRVVLRRRHDRVTGRTDDLPRAWRDIRLSIG